MSDEPISVASGVETSAAATSLERGATAFRQLSAMMARQREYQLAHYQHFRLLVELGHRPGRGVIRPIFEFLPAYCDVPFWDWQADKVCGLCRGEQLPCGCEFPGDAMAWRRGDPIYPPPRTETTP